VPLTVSATPLVVPPVPFKNKKPKENLGRQLKGQLGLGYEGFLELPVPLVLGVMWLAGVALIGSCALALLSLFWLLTVVGGA
jgi:hypothetical protein